MYFKIQQIICFVRLQ